MIVHLKIGNQEYSAKLNEPIDISIPLHSGNDNVNAWYAPPPEIVPVRMDSWVGEVHERRSPRNQRNSIVLLGRRFSGCSSCAHASFCNGIFKPQ